MPELPEVETVRRQLAPVLIGQTITGVEVFHAKSVAHDPTIEDALCNRTIADITRVGKLLIFSFTDTDEIYLLAHLKMTGQFFYVDNDQSIQGGGHRVSPHDIRDLPNRHTRVAYYFANGSALYFNDMRLFGYTKLGTKEEVAIAQAGFGPEPIDADFPLEWFVSSIRKKRTVVKAALLDQRFVAGLGNIYVDEALFRAGVRPGRRCDRLRIAEARAIGEASGEVMREAIDVGGTTFQHFADTGGHAGNFTDHLRVFNRTDAPCPQCGAPVKKIRVAGRGTHYCPGCQS